MIVLLYRNTHKKTLKEKISPKAICLTLRLDTGLKEFHNQGLFSCEKVTFLSLDFSNTLRAKNGSGEDSKMVCVKW